MSEDRAGHARDLVMRLGWNATAYQILNPGIDRWFSASDDAVIGFVRSAGVRVVAGAPVCSLERLPEVVAEFQRDARAAGERVCYFGAGERLEHALTPTGAWSPASLGAQPSWDPSHWAAIIDRKASLRAQVSRARNKQVRVVEYPHERAETSGDLRRCLTEWLGTRGLPALHFLVEPETLDNLRDRRVFVAELTVGAPHPVGFLIASPVPAREGWLVEQTIRGTDAPNGTAELLIDAAMRTLAADGARYVTLGLAPLSRQSHFDEHRMPPWLRVALGWVRLHGRRFYNFEGLDWFKTKLEPEYWEEILAFADAPSFPPRALWAIAGAFSGGSPLALMGAAVGRAARQEWTWFKHRHA